MSAPAAFAGAATNRVTYCVRCGRPVEDVRRQARGAARCEACRARCCFFCHGRLGDAERVAMPSGDVAHSACYFEAELHEGC